MTGRGHSIPRLRIWAWCATAVAAIAVAALVLTLIHSDLAEPRWGT